MLERIQQAGELRVITRNSPTTYYLGPKGYAGFEFDLVNLFADFIGVRPKFIVVESFNEIIPRLARGEAHLAAAGLTVTEKRKRLVRFAVPVQQITQQLVYRAGNRRLRRYEELIGSDIEVVAGSSHVARLVELKAEYPQLSWHENRELDNEDLLYIIWEKLIDFTVADSNLLAVVRRFYPELRIAFDITDPQDLAWAFPHSEDTSLYDEATRFLQHVRKDGTLAHIRGRYYGHIERFDYVGTRTYRRHINQRLPKLLSFFKAAAEANGLDWRLLAAIGYQESHWNPKAVSPTGVRGIMMLTQITARQVGIEKRTDPEQSIVGGGRYFTLVKKRISEQIPEPDRTWMALAAYNIGVGHLRDAWRLTKIRGGNPDRWVDVKETLPLLSQKKWYTKTGYGYARGREAVHFVENIRSYYDILVWARCDKTTETNKPSALYSAPRAL